MHNWPKIENGDVPAFIAEVRRIDPDFPNGDRGPCLPSWIQGFKRWHDAGEGKALSHSTVGAVLHMLVAQAIRIERLIEERDQRTPDA